MQITMQGLLDIQEEMATQMGICTTAAISERGVARIDLGTTDECYLAFHKDTVQLLAKDLARKFPYSFANVFHSLGLVDNLTPNTNDDFPIERFNQDFFWMLAPDINRMRLHMRQGRKSLPYFITRNPHQGDYILHTENDTQSYYPTEERARHAGLRVALTRGFYSHKDALPHIWSCSLSLKESLYMRFNGDGISHSSVSLHESLGTVVDNLLDLPTYF